jgi:hypothetical protein
LPAAKHDGVTTGARIAEVRPVRHYHLADRPERESSELHMRPREGNADDRAGKENGGDEMAERHPATSSHTRLPRTRRGPIAMSLICSRKGAVYRQRC